MSLWKIHKHKNLPKRLALQLTTSMSHEIKRLFTCIPCWQWKWKKMWSNPTKNVKSFLINFLNFTVEKRITKFFQIPAPRQGYYRDNAFDVQKHPTHIDDTEEFFQNTNVFFFTIELSSYQPGGSLYVKISIMVRAQRGVKVF